MIDLICPDGSETPVRRWRDGQGGRRLDCSLLAKRAALVKLDGELLDVERPLAHGGHFEILSQRQPREPLETLRHDASSHHG